MGFLPLQVMSVKYTLIRYLEPIYRIVAVLSLFRRAHLYDSISVSGAASCFLPPGPAVNTTFNDRFSQLSLSVLQTGNTTYDSKLCLIPDTDEKNCHRLLHAALIYGNTAIYSFYLIYKITRQQ